MLRYSQTAVSYPSTKRGKLLAWLCKKLTNVRTRICKTRKLPYHISFASCIRKTKVWNRLSCGFTAGGEWTSARQHFVLNKAYFITWFVFHTQLAWEEKNKTKNIYIHFKPVSFMWLSFTSKLILCLINVRTVIVVCLITQTWDNNYAFVTCTDFHEGNHSSRTSGLQ